MADKKNFKINLKEEELNIVSYIFGILSIVFSFLTPLAGIILGIIGISYVKGKPKIGLSKRAKLFNIIGIILSIIFLIISFAVAFYFASKGVSNFPIA